MKFSEFYDKYIVVRLPNGETVKPRRLTVDEKLFWDKKEHLNYDENKVDYTDNLD